MRLLAVRREDKNIWERRTPLIPEDLKSLIEAGEIEAVVQPSEIRVFQDAEYTGIGARLAEDISAAEFIFGIKEIPIDRIFDRKVYVFFSHVIKGQRKNMPMLKRIMDSGSTVIDYEMIVDAQGRRLVFFGRFAGLAGALDIVWLLGENLKSRGIDNPFTECKQALQYRSVEEAKNHLSEVGKKISSHGLGSQLSPFIIGILGYGHVSLGAQEIFDCLPCQRVEPEDLSQLVAKKEFNDRTVYISVFKEEHLVRRRDGKPFQLQDYYDHPEEYLPQLEPYLPHMNILVNAIYWDARYPRFVTFENMRQLLMDHPGNRFWAIADLTCDVDGSIECNVRAANSGEPAYRCDPLTGTIADGHLGDGVVILAVDNLPCELPRDSSVYFSHVLKEFVPNILRADYTKPLKESGLVPPIRNAVIVYNGELTADYEYIKKYIT